MPVNETIELKEQVDEILGMPMGYLIANGIYPTLFTPREASQIEQLRNSRGRLDDLQGRMLKSALFRHERCDLQARYRARLKRSMKLPIIEVPYYFEPELNFDIISRIASHIEASVGRQEIGR